MEFLGEKKDHSLIYKFIIYHRMMTNAIKKCRVRGQKLMGGLLLARVVGKASLKRWHLNEDFSEVRGPQ